MNHPEHHDPALKPAQDGLPEHELVQHSLAQNDLTQHRLTQDRLARAALSLEGLSCGDAFGERFFLLQPREIAEQVRQRTLPDGIWPFTDDTMMAISIVETLRLHGRILETSLADHFARMYDPSRGYGAATHRLLLSIGLRGAEFWQQESASLFEGRGSFGNGSAMRVAPLGAYFADDLDLLVDQARRSAIITHCHPEAIAGAVAVALGAALAWRSCAQPEPPPLQDFLAAVLERTPPGTVRDGIAKAVELDPGTPALRAAMILGNGSHITAMDTVPFVLWSAGSHLDNYEEAIWQTVSGLGDKDTTCAMVGGIVALRSGVPEAWQRRREPLFGG